jgi:excisionase family DNA binding protein
MKAYRIVDLATRWQMAPATLYKMVQDGRLAAMRLGGRSIRISATEVEAWESGARTRSDDTASELSTERPSPSGVRLASVVDSALASVRSTRDDWP